MQIKLYVGNDGIPCLEINANYSYDNNLDYTLMQYFIKEAIKNGLIVKKEKCEFVYSYANIKIRINMKSLLT